jgi:hypothetical protein
VNGVCRASFPRRWLTAAAFVSAPVVAAAAPADVSELLVRVGERVEQYFARAQSLVFTETVTIEPLSANFLAEGGHARELVYDVRVSWERGTDGEGPDVKLLRELVKVDGRTPRSGDEPECADPEAVATEPLVMLLPRHQHEYQFTAQSVDTVAARNTVVLDYVSLTRGPAAVDFEGDCVSVALPGRSRGRIWVDEASGDILRLDSQLIGSFEFAIPQRYRRRGAPVSMVMERADSSIRYRSVHFTDPDETMMLPASVRSTTVFRHAPSPRTRMIQTFSNYRRFITAGRIVK